MGRYLGPREKIERRIGEKLFLKGERSHSQKSAMTRRPYPPGVHGKARRMRPSEFSQQLKSKQKVRNIYRLMEKQFKSYIKTALAIQKDTNAEIIYMLEGRLDNFVFRSGFAQSHDQARQIVSHGHILVNQKRVKIPSYETKIGDIVTIREGSKKMPYFTALMPQWLKAYEAPGWVELDKTKVTARRKGDPQMEDSGLKPDDLRAIVEYYSR
jgi:small subunit ribosomal protein S4